MKDKVWTTADQEPTEGPRRMNQTCPDEGHGRRPDGGPAYGPGGRGEGPARSGKDQKENWKMEQMKDLEN
ncbi:hypothetical protein CBR_g40450 [Chara braunii]|uniref:Uncharacterized protein n=1 Tax=Chara braunii TaxID=69332 RepID=A0A388LU33_CHABU|nr:hypothetical protein CBR_g40450 [Chara braunii]|eukprot:GBG85722.1 hypothetical protein CBR_g40450 [Chara braunii]